MINTLSAIDIEKDPYLLWNTFMRILACGPESLTDEQRPASLVFWSDSEVQNGGHLQYFLNRANDPKHETVSALTALGTVELSNLLKTAYKRWSTTLREQFSSEEKFVQEALGGEFDDLDSAYYAARPTAIEALERHLNGNVGRFIRVAE
jgi:hypothetical protein